MASQLMPLAEAQLRAVEVMTGLIVARHPEARHDDGPWRDSLLAFTERMFPRYEPAPHHAEIAEHLERVAAGDLHRLIITMPPRHGKTTLASEHFPPWFLGNHPEKRIIACSHTAFLAYILSRRARNIIQSPFYPFHETRIARDLGSVQAWDVEGKRGGYVAAGVGGTVTGLGADVLLIDDPIRNAADADSATMRESVWEWFTGTAATRLEPHAAIVVIGTRWHEADLIGRLLATDRWELLHYPAINEFGAALWPERFDVDALEAKRAEVGSRNFEAQYQGAPSPPEGGILKRNWWGFWRPEYGTLNARSSFSYVIQAWDTAFKKGRENDYSAGITIGVRPNGYYVLDLYHDRAEYPELKRAVATQYEKWRPDEVLIEDAGSGQSLIQELRTDTRLPVLPFKPDRDKLARVNAITPTVEAGNVFLPAVEAEWVDAFIEEAAGFPNATHDDMVDAFAMAIGQLVIRDGQSGVIDADYARYLADAPMVGAGW